MIVTINSFTIPDYQSLGAVATIRAYATKNFFGASGVEHIAGVAGSVFFYKLVACTVAANVVTVPAFTLESTTDSSEDSAQYILALYDANNNLVAILNNGRPFYVPPTTPANLSDLSAYTHAPRRTRPDQAFSTDQSDARYVRQTQFNWTSIGKPASEARSSTTVLALDSQLQFPVTAGIAYNFELEVFYLTDPVADFKFAVNNATGDMIYRGETAAPDAVITQLTGVALGGSLGSTTILSAANAYGRIYLRGLFVCSVNGVFGFSWAQNTSSGVPTQVVVGSTLNYRHV
jgi:hypothetical protein